LPYAEARQESDRTVVKEVLSGLDASPRVGVEYIARRSSHISTVES
jgi:hypothetical protein